MPLLAQKPSYIKQRLKLLMFGLPNVGKTTAALNFPAPYFIDTEQGAIYQSYLEILDKNNGKILQTQDFDIILEQVKCLLTEKHEYKTLVIDSITLVYEGLLRQAEDKVGTDFGRHYNEANKAMKHLLNLTLRLDMNVVFTAHSKTEYGDGMITIGQIPDCYKKLPYIFDMVLELKTEADHTMAYIRKNRLKIADEWHRFKFDYESFTNLIADEVALEKPATIKELATPEQVKKINSLFNILKVEPEQITKGLGKVNAETLEEVDKGLMEKWINTLTRRINNDIHVSAVNG